MKRYAGLHLAESAGITAANPMGWTAAYRGDWAALLDDWADNLRGRCDGVVVGRADGACRTRAVGRQSDGDHVTTEFASIDMLGEQEHRQRRVFVMALAGATDVVWNTGIPAPDRVAMALERVADLRVRRVCVDVSGQNLGGACADFVEGLLSMGLVVYDEPRCHPDLRQPVFAGKVKTCSGPERFALLDRRGVEIPAGSIVRHNANHPATDGGRAYCRARGFALCEARREFGTAGEADL